MGQDPGEIRQEIEATRTRIGDTVEAIAYKTDVKARVGDSIADKREALLGKKDEMVSRITGAAPDGEDIKGNARQAVSLAHENPRGLAVGAIAIGFLAGMVIPTTSIENEKIGPLSDQVKDRAGQVGQDALQHGQEVAQEVAQNATQTAQQSARRHGQELASAASSQARDSVSDIKAATPTGDSSF